MEAEKRKCRVCDSVIEGGRCKPCNQRISREYYKNNLEKVKAAAAKARKENATELSAKAKAYREANAAKVRAQKAVHAAKNSEKIVARVGAWRKANPDAKRIQSHNYRARKTGKGRLSRGLAARLMAEQGGICACCMLRLDEGYHMDHVIPLAKGGMNVDSNIQLLAPICNGRKHAKMPEVYAAQYGAENVLG